VVFYLQNQECMTRFFGILIVGFVIAMVTSSVASAKVSASRKSAVVPSTSQKKPTQDEKDASAEPVLVADGLAHDVMSLMTGIRHPIDASTNLTIQAGTSLRLGITF
jgi:hypothetical protein